MSKGTAARGPEVGIRETLENALRAAKVAMDAVDAEARVEEDALCAAAKVDAHGGRGGHGMDPFGGTRSKRLRAGMEYDRAVKAAKAAYLAAGGEF